METLGELITRGILALREGDHDAQDRRSRRLAHALHRFDGTWRAMGVRDAADVDEVRQTLLIKLWRTMARWASGAELPSDLGGYARQIGVNVARDLLASRGRMRKRQADRPMDDPVVEASGAFSLHELALRAEEELRVEEWSARLREHLEAYILQARRTAVRDPARMLGVWYALRVHRRAALDLATELGVTEATIWQWARRGAALIARLAAADPDLDRAEAMRAASLAA